MKLYDHLPTEIEYEGKKYKIRPYFNRVLYCVDIFNDKEYGTPEKIEYCCEALLYSTSRLDIYQKAEILNSIINLLFDEKNNSSNKKSFDFTQDSKYIYAGFMQCYGIDLFECKNKLHWWKFVSLFQGLSKDTKMMEIIDIRTKPIPNRDKYNGEYITNLIKLKAEYQLEFTQEEREAQMQESLKGLFNSLKNMAERE